MSLGSSNRLRHYYENILRRDLLLKLNYRNIMQVPKLCKIQAAVKWPPKRRQIPTSNLQPAEAARRDAASLPPNGGLAASKNYKNAALALEIMCGQKISIQFSGTNQSPSATFDAPKRDKKKLTAVKKSATRRPLRTYQARQHFAYASSSFSSANLFCSLHGDTMYGFLEKLISILIASYDYKIQVFDQIIQITLGSRELRMFPEIQNHFEYFECITEFQIKLVTSAKNKEETQLLWNGLNQKEN